MSSGNSPAGSRAAQAIRHPEQAPDGALDLNRHLLMVSIVRRINLFANTNFHRMQADTAGTAAPGDVCSRDSERQNGEIFLRGNNRRTVVKGK